MPALLLLALPWLKAAWRPIAVVAAIAAVVLGAYLFGRHEGVASRLELEAAALARQRTFDAAETVKAMADADARIAQLATAQADNERKVQAYEAQLAPVTVRPVPGKPPRRSAPSGCGLTDADVGSLRGLAVPR